MPNPHEERARARKATAIAEYIWESLTAERRRDPETVVAARQSGQPARDTVAHDAGQKSPSEETWDIVVEWLGRHVRWAIQDAA